MNRGQKRARRTRASMLDVRAVEAVKRFVRVLARCGCPPKDIAAEVAQACYAVPKSWIYSPRVAIRDLDAAAHIVTLWYSDPRCLDPAGNPRPLPLRGLSPSVESLLFEVDRTLDPHDVLRHLLRRKVLRRVRTRYVPRERLVSFRGAGAPHYVRCLRVLGSMLRTLEHNNEPERTTPGWFEVTAVNSRLPVSACKGFDDRLRKQGMRLLAPLDGYMHNRERTRKKGEGTVCMGVGIYQFVEDSLPGRRGVRRPPGRSRQ